MNNYKKCTNQGSALVEMTLLIPVILGVVYFSILFFLFMVKGSDCMEDLAECLYHTEETLGDNNGSNTISLQKQGNMKTVQIQEEGKLFKIQLELRGNGSNPVELVRRWQLAVNTIS